MYGSFRDPNEVGSGGGTDVDAGGNGDLTFVANGDVANSWDGVAVFRGVSEGDSIRYAIAKREPLRVEQENFRDALWGRPSEAVSMREGVHTLTVVEAVLQSAQTGQTVSL